MDQGRAPWPPKRSEAEQRKMAARLLYDLEVEYRKVGWGDPAYVYGEEKNLTFARASSRTGLPTETTR